jgi:serine/arginine repetitive matrix protein 2
MYNGIGLQTARGSGTSGYVQKNLSFVKPFKQQRSKEDFLKELQALKVIVTLLYEIIN